MARDHRRISEEVAQAILLDDSTVLKETRLFLGIQPGSRRASDLVIGFGVITQPETRRNLNP